MMLVRMGRTLNLVVCAWEGLWGISDIIFLCVCVGGVVMVWHIGCSNPFSTWCSRCDSAWKDLISKTEFCPMISPISWWEMASCHNNAAPQPISAAICRASLVASTSAWLSARQLWFIHGFCHVKMIHNSTLSKPMQHAWSLAHSLLLPAFINLVLSTYWFAFMLELHFLFV